MQMIVGWVSLSMCALIAAAELAAVPPKGWNSYLSFGSNITEDQFLDNCRRAAVLLRPSGYQYCVVDIAWFQSKDGKSISLDGFGRPQPDPWRWPSSSNGAGFAKVAAAVHALSMQFGLHIMRGASADAVAMKLPVKGHPGVTIDQLVVGEESCPWFSAWKSVNVTHPAGQAFYDGMFEQFADWGVDFVKCDCVYGNYAPQQVMAQSAAIDKAGRPMVYSLSPGPGTLARARQIGPFVNMYRITNDNWDHWSSLQAHWEAAASTASLIAARGHHGRSWPDADLLPLGCIADPAMGWPPNGTWCHPSYLSEAEQRSEMTLWAAMRSPLFMSGDLRHVDERTLRLLTNPAVLELVDNSSQNCQVLPKGTAGAPWQEGDRLPLAACTTFQDRLMWKLRPDGSVQSVQSDGCLNAWGCEWTSGSVVSVDHVCPPVGCDNGNNGRWNYSHDTGELRSRVSNESAPLCFDAASELWDCNGSAIQGWDVSPVAGVANAFTLRSRGNGMCLSMPSTAESARTTHPGDARVWAAIGSATQGDTDPLLVSLFNTRDVLANVSVRLQEIAQALQLTEPLAVGCGRQGTVTEHWTENNNVTLAGSLGNQTLRIELHAHDVALVRLRGCVVRRHSAGR